ncbi:MAG TPA: alpha/beta hydrolase [Candidatus Paceibacterota bacterium]
MKQVLIIGGGDSFKNHRVYLKFLKNFKIDLKKYRAGKHDWKENLQKKLGNNFDVFLPTMPNRTNAKYSEWKIWFNKLIPQIKSGVILIGHSLGALFLIKYLSENKFPKKIRAVFLMAPPYNEGSFSRPRNFRQLEKQAGKLFIYYSEDDKIVSIKDIEKYKKNVLSAIYKIFEHQGHFNKRSIPGLSREIKKLYK